MQEKTRACPECNGVMQLRLGEYQCQSCPHSMVAAAAEEPRRSSSGGGSSYGGASSYGGGSSGYGSGPSYGGSTGGAPKPANAQWDPGAQYRNNAPPPPPPGAPGSMLGNYETGATFNESSARDSLHMEKIAYLVAAGLVGTVGGYLQINAGGPGTEPLSMLGPAGVIGSLIFGALIYVGILALALFAGSTALKWTCLGCNGCTALSAVFVLLGGSALMAGQGDSNPISLVLNLAMAGWLIWLLWRDIQQT